MVVVDDLELAARQRRRRWAYLGFGLTFVGFVILLGVGLKYWPPNPSISDVGTFLGGGAALLAFIWLVVGYLQQNAELSLSTRALTEQIKEMKESVEEQKRQTESFQRQTESLQLSEAHARRDAVLKIIDIYLGRLAAHASIAVYRVSGAPLHIINEGWQYYAAGDKDYFFRFLLPGNQPIGYLDGSLANAMGNSPEVAVAVHSYIDEYEKFLAYVRPLDSTSDFLPLFEQGHAGRVYRAMKRVEHAVQRSPKLD